MERGGAVPYELRVGVQLQSGGVRIPMQCPDTAKPPGGVSERTKHTTAQTERKKNKEMESNGGDKRQEERTMRC